MYGCPFLNVRSLKKFTLYQSKQELTIKNVFKILVFITFWHICRIIRRKRVYLLLTYIHIVLCMLIFITLWTYMV
jgi:hypothetical protein